MRRPDFDGEKPWQDAAARALWHRAAAAESAEDEPARYLDLAGFADGTLDADDRERVAAWIERDPAAAADIAAASRVPGLLPASAPGDAAIIARAIALAPPERGQVIALAGRRRATIAPRLAGWARWGSLAAAIVVAGWLGFAMGSDASLTFNQLNQSNDEGVLHEVFDPSTGFLRDLTEGTQT